MNSRRDDSGGVNDPVMNVLIGTFTRCNESRVSCSIQIVQIIQVIHGLVAAF